MSTSGNRFASAYQITGATARRAAAILRLVCHPALRLLRSANAPALGSGTKQKRHPRTGARL